MDITVDTGENKVVVHIEKYARTKSFAVIMNYETGTTVKASLDDLIKALEIVAGNKGTFSKAEERANTGLQADGRVRARKNAKVANPPAAKA